MKKITLLFAGLLLAIGAFVPANDANAGWVSGYYRSNGTYVSGYYRSSPSRSYTSYSYPSYSYSYPSYSYSYSRPKLEYVRSYYKPSSNTWVSGYYRTKADSTIYNNRIYSYGW